MNTGHFQVKMFLRVLVIFQTKVIHEYVITCHMRIRTMTNYMMKWYY